jgi:ketosteroid isomerase-like protein
MFAFATLAGCKSAPAPLTDADRAMARQMDSSMAAAASSGNATAAMAGYAPDAIVMPPGMPMASGTDQIQKLWQGMMTQKATLQLSQSTADGAGDFMYTTGTYHYQMPPAGSGPSENGKYLEVFRRGADGKWMVAAYSWSANAQPAPAPAASARPAAGGRAK